MKREKLTQSEIDAIKEKFAGIPLQCRDSYLQGAIEYSEKERQRAKVLLRCLEDIETDDMNLHDKIMIALNTYNKNKPNDRE